MTKELLQLRKRIKSKKPTFVRQDTHKRKRIRKRWQRPRGWQSKIRLNKRGYRKTVRPGYGSPKKVAGLHSSGLKIIRINSEAELKGIDPETQGIIIASSVGTKKKISIIKKTKDAGITILHIKYPDSYLKKVEENIKKKKEEKTKKEDKKKQAEKKKAAEKKPKLSEKLTEEEKKEEEKKEKDQLLTKKEG